MTSWIGVCGVSVVVVIWRCRFSEYFVYHYHSLFVWKVRRTFFPFRVVFFYPMVVQEL